MFKRRRFVVALSRGCVSSATGFGSTTDVINHDIYNIIIIESKKKTIFIPPPKIFFFPC